MATLTELTGLLGDPTLSPKIRGALLVASQTIVALGAGASAAQKEFARECFRQPAQFEAMALSAVLAANAGQTTAVILGASDSAIQTNVNAVLPILVG